MPLHISTYDVTYTIKKNPVTVAHGGKVI